MKEEEIRAQWSEFKEVVIERHHLLPDYEPNMASILLWEEYKASKEGI